MKQVQLYSRQNCSLCDEAFLTLQLIAEDIPLTIEVIDIEQDEQLHERYVFEIPVLRYNNLELKNEAINYVEVLQLLQNE